MTSAGSTSKSHISGARRSTKGCVGHETETAISGDWEPSDALDDRLTDPEVLEFPDGWTLSTSWQRASRFEGEVDAVAVEVLPWSSGKSIETHMEPEGIRYI